MPLSSGRKLLAIPGPTNLPDEVLQAMHAQPLDIFGGPLEEITNSILADLKRVFRSESARTFIYICNGHGSWEAGLSNVLSRGDKVLALVSGPFSKSWAETTIKMGADVETLVAEPGRAIDPLAVEQRLRADKQQSIKAVLTVQIDTATSVVNDVAAIRAAIDAAEHPALYCVDGIASIGCIPFEMDRWGVDLALTASQKGLMSPPGMAFVAASERAWEARLSADMRTAYWEWDGRLGEMHYQKYCGTPPVQSLYGLRRALDMLLEEEGLEAVWRRHRLLAEATRGAISTWAEQGGVDFYVPAPSERSDTVTTLVAPDGCDANALRDFASEKCGVTFGYPVGGFIPSERGFRIAHMGHFNAPMALGSLGALEVAMAALGWPGASGGVSTAAAMLGSALTQE